MAPLQRKLIDPTLLNSMEINWIDDYHKEVRDKLLPQLQRKEDDKLARQYLLRETEPIDLNGRL